MWAVAGLPVTGKRQGTGRIGAADHGGRTRGCLYTEAPLCIFSNLFLFFTYPLTRTSESSDALHKLAADEGVGAAVYLQV